MKRLPMRSGSRGLAERGFSLLELSIVLLILGVLFGSVIRPIIADQENRVTNETRAVLDEARGALLSYVAAKGYFPCPADAVSNGFESKGAGADASHKTGNCASWHGFLPAAVLGLPSVDMQGYAVDGTRRPQNRIRYAVTNQTIVGVTNPFTRVDGISTVGLASLGSENLFFICSSGMGVTPGTDCGLVGKTLTRQAVAVIWSIGGNAATGGTSLDEAQNTNPQSVSEDRIFVAKASSSTPGAEFDDVVSWIHVGAVVERLLAYGRLP